MRCYQFDARPLEGNTVGTRWLQVMPFGSALETGSRASEARPDAQPGVRSGDNPGKPDRCTRLIEGTHHFISFRSFAGMGRRWQLREVVSSAMRVVEASRRRRQDHRCSGDASGVEVDGPPAEEPGVDPLQVESLAQLR